MNALPRFTSTTLVRIVAAAVGFSVALATQLPARPIGISADVAGFTSRLPVLIIDNDGRGPLLKSGPDHVAELAVLDAAGGLARIGVNPVPSTPITISIRGASSADFPKKSFNLTLRNSRGSKEARSLLGLPASDKWALVAPWKFDPTFINNAFVYALSNRIGRWAPRTRFVEVFFTTRGGEVTPADYAGIYILTERIEPGAERVDIARLSARDDTLPAISGGYILKIDQPASGDVAWKPSYALSANAESSVVLVAPRAEDVTPAQQSYIRDYVRQMENSLRADHASAWMQRTSLDFIDRPSWIDHHLINTFVCNPDALVRSAYFTKDRGGRLVAGPVWDFDRALGSYWDERSFRWDVWTGNGAVDVWRTGWWGILAQDPEFMQEWIDRWQSLRTAELATREIVQLARSLANDLGPEAAARDAARWPDNVSPSGSHAAEIERLAGWLALRAGWIDGQLLTAPAVHREEGLVTFTAPAGAQLAFTTDGSDPRSRGGNIAPNAKLTSGSLTVAIDVNVHVRSYRADRRGEFPGSPWSMAVGGPRSSPLTPRARMVNFSSRGWIGTGDEVMITGFVVADTTAKRYLSRAIGPGLAAFGGDGFVRDPQLRLTAASGVELARNAGWQTDEWTVELSALARSVGAFPLAVDSLDAALANELPAAGYILNASTPSGAAGNGLVELYEVDALGRTTNHSTRAMIPRGGESLAAGFVVRGPAFQRVLIRAIGPGLIRLGVSNALADPGLILRAGSHVVAHNDRWSATEDVGALVQSTAMVGAFSLIEGSEDAALLVALPPGAYTVEVNDKGGAGGIVLLEIHDVP